MSNPINLSDLGTLIINEKNLPTRYQFDVLTNKYNEFINTVFLDTFGNLVSWVKPTNIASITSLSSFPDNYIFVKGKSTRQRITFTSSSQLHNNVVSKMISSIQIIVNGITSNLDLTTSGIVIDRLNKTIDFNYTASSLLQHDIIVKLRNTNLLEIGSTISTNYTISVQSSRIIELEFPDIGVTIKNSPHDVGTVTVGETLSMTSTFLSVLPLGITNKVIINDGTNDIIATSSNSSNKVDYSFIIINDTDHTGIITLSFGDIINNYSWTATNLLTADYHIYSFPNSITYDGSSNSLPIGYHIAVSESNELTLTFIGGDNLHSDNYSSQINKIEYITNEITKVVNQTNTSINSTNNTITLTNIIPDVIGDINFIVILISPNGVQKTLTFTIASTFILQLPDSRVRTGIGFSGWGSITTSFSSDSSDIWGYWYHYNTAHYGYSGVVVQNPTNDWVASEYAYQTLGHGPSLTMFEVFGSASVTATAYNAVGYTHADNLALSFYQVADSTTVFTLPGDGSGSVSNATFIGRLYDINDSITLTNGYYVSYYDWGNRQIYVRLTYTNWPSERNVLIDEV